MDYLSTRGAMPPASFSEIVIQGLAPDGGLVVPHRLPRLDARELAAWRGYDYRQLAYAIISRFAPDLAPAALRGIIARAYTAETFASDAVTPVERLADNLYLLKLSNGPTLAFKDLAMQFLGELLSHVLAERGSELNILGATSGDTGSAAEYAMRGKPNIRVFMLSPHQRLSPFQAAQMFSVHEPNIFNLAVRGVFDDCQDIVKAINQDLDFKTRYRIGAVNSINWARVVAQVVYYFKAYFAVSEHAARHAQRRQRPIAMAVPSGNFGNVYAGHLARRMGLPISRLILATNENKVLDEFFRSGVYRPRQSSEVHTTSSPSMDISKASNFERFVYDLVDQDSQQVVDLWRQLGQRGFFDLSAHPAFAAMDRFGFVSGSSSHADRLATIQGVYRDYGKVIDTHTADGLKVGLEYQRRSSDPDEILVCLETAQPVKFESAVSEALGFTPPRPEAYIGLETRPQRVELIDADSAAVKAFIEKTVNRP